MALSLVGCGYVYYNDDGKKNYDKQYIPSAKAPSELSEEQKQEIISTVATIWNTAQTEKYEAELKRVESERAALASVVAASSAISSNATSSKMTSSTSSTTSVASSSINSSIEVAVVQPPAEPDIKTADDIKIYGYFGVYNGYTAVEYKIKGHASVVMRTLTNDIIGSYNFSFYQDSATKALYKDGKLYTIREVYESSLITDTNLKDLWYYMYVVN